MPHPENLVSLANRTPEERREIARAGAAASNAAQKERKTIADVLRKLMDEPASLGSQVTRQEALVAKCIQNAFKRGDLKDLRMVAELLGELKQKVELSGESVIRVVGTEEEKKKLENIGDLGI